VLSQQAFSPDAKDRDAFSPKVLAQSTPTLATGSSPATAFDFRHRISPFF
jgi:hypothetical protein